MKQFKKQIVATRKPVTAEETEIEPKGSVAPEGKVRFRRLIDKDEVEAIVAEAIDRVIVPTPLIDDFCKREGYVDTAAHRVNALVWHLFNIRKKQHEEAKQVMTK